MEYVGILTEQQKQLLDGQLIQNDWYFNPILSGGTLPYVITEQEISASIFPQNDWVKQLPLVEYNPSIIPSGSTL